MEKTNIARLIFATGLVITAQVNGNCYITDEKPDFPEDISEITVEQGEETTEIKDAQLIECASTDGRYWFAFHEMTADEKWKADIEDALCDLSME